MTDANQGEAANPPEPEPTAADDAATDTLIGRTLKIATKYQGLLLAYLVSVAATIGGMSYLGHNDDSLHNRWWLLFAWLLTLLPLLATFLTMTLPAWRKKRREARLKQWSIEGKETRPGYFRIGPYEETEHDREHFQRADQALDWIASSTLPLLFLTGASGAGKSSLLSAHVIPHLREGQPATRVISLRSFDDPLAMLREQLLTPEVIWQKPPKVDAETSLLELLQDACEYLDKWDEWLLLVLDQFEELLILHEKPESTPGEPSDEPAPGLVIIEAVRQFLHEVQNQPLPGLCVLLALRTDYEGMLSRLELPPLEQGRNWFKVSPFTERAARDFLAGGFKSGINETLLDRVLSEAATVEETRGLIRPITLNMLGTVLTRMSGELSGREQHGGLLAADVRRTLNTPQLRDHAAEVLTPLLTDSGTKHPRRVDELAKVTQLEPHVIEGCLLGPSNRGLVRRLNRAPQLADRV